VKSTEPPGLRAKPLELERGPVDNDAIRARRRPYDG
jgi:hypothetical protein